MEKAQNSGKKFKYEYEFEKNPQQQELMKKLENKLIKDTLAPQDMRYALQSLQKNVIIK